MITSQTIRYSIFMALFLLFSLVTKAEDGYELWLRYPKIQDSQLKASYTAKIKSMCFEGKSAVVKAAIDEMKLGITGMLGYAPGLVSGVKTTGVVVAGTPADKGVIAGLKLDDKLKKCGDEGYLLFTGDVRGKKNIIIAANTDIGVLYGTFHLLRLLQTHQGIENISFQESPKIQYRLLNHWDNLDRTVERGYAGFSIWDWHALPDILSPQYSDYARANASIGINGAVLTNVNANAWVLTPQYLEKVAALADIFRPYGIKVYLTARFSAPIEIGGLKHADPLDPEVQKWWDKKIDEIYSYIPDFGGFAVKANSEGQPGPQNYQRNHADGANMLASALAKHGGIVMWRAFVYEYDPNEDRARQANNEFEPLDGSFRNNVMVQVKNGPIDFQPREPFHPLFGAMPKTPLIMEFQITQEYLGHATHLVYKAPLYKECLEADTYAKGPGSTVSKIIDGSLYNHSISGMAGVSNIGTDRNWTGHPFAQANWYALGRLAWDHNLTSEEIAEEWLRMTFSNDKSFLVPVKELMLYSREACVDYMTPVGLHHIMGWDHHFGPGPWVNIGRKDWTSVYYHNASEKGIGFDRTTTGSNAVGQYHPPVKELFNSREKCPEIFLLWFHHVEWDYKMSSGRTLWDELCFKYYNGVESVRQMQKTWDTMQDKVDANRFRHIKELLARQEKEAVLWRNSCLLYFQTFSKRPIPEQYEQPEHPLEYYINLDFRYAPGILHCN